MTFLGSVVNRILGILKDPAQLLDPIKKFFNAIIGMVNVVIKALWDITGAPINFIIGGINDGAKFIIDSINSVSSKLNLPEIPEFSIPLVPGPPTIPDIPLSKTAQEKNEGAVAMAGGGVVPGYGSGGVVTDPEERKQQEAYMLKFVNEERALQGMEPLNDLTYAPGVELTKMMGPGPKTTETSDTDMNFDTGMKSTWKTKSRGGETIFQGSTEMITQEDRDKFFAANPHAAQLVKIKDQMELDALGADISASAKMNGGGLVRGFKGGGIVPLGSATGYGEAKGGSVKFTGEQLKKLVKNGSTKKIPTITPPTTKPKVTVVNQPGTEEVDASQTQLPTGGNREIPSFDATLIRSSHKMEVLGISI